ncbi:MAG: L-2-hydroxyglutarate oxidase [Chloroflexota bacterium]|nr:L-2-hydroxyglutarate oxidase [Chloroflexota bacterium]MDE2686279.1 L-2-hydroxyglutarate oxidase [Chloroflexota bacterium]
MSFQNSYDIAVIGAGIIGLATAMRLAEEYPRYKIVVLEKDGEVAQHQTGHNSGVIHAGIYYAPGSQKANFCSTGGRLLRQFCDERGIEYEMCGKVIVAITDEEVPRLQDLFERGTANGAEGLEMIGPERLAELEPYSAGVQAIFSPNTGIIDFKKVSQAYAIEFGENGGDLMLNTAVHGITRRDGQMYLETSRGDITARHIINCAGLQADKVARMTGAEPGLRIIPFRGEYFSIKPERQYLVRSLIYPVPDPSLPFLGVHFTKRITGGVEAGPNAVLAFAREGYTKTSFNLGEAFETLTYPGFWKMSLTHWKSGIDEQHRSLRKSLFLTSLQTLVPSIEMDDLSEPGAGVRAQAVDSNGNLLQDFAISETENAIHVLSAPSPGATSSLTISRYIVDMAVGAFGLEG